MLCGRQFEDDGFCPECGCQLDCEDHEEGCLEVQRELAESREDDAREEDYRERMSHDRA